MAIFIFNDSSREGMDKNKFFLEQQGELSRMDYASMIDS